MNTLKRNGLITLGSATLCAFIILVSFSSGQNNNSLAIHRILRWPGIQLSQVSCSNAGKCLAVGSRITHGNSDANVVAVRRIAAAWSRPYQLGTRVSGSGDGSVSVACVDDNSCVVYGQLGFRPYPLLGVTSRRAPIFREYHDPKIIIPNDDFHHHVACYRAGECWSIVQITGNGFGTISAAVGYVGGKWLAPYQLGVPLINPKLSTDTTVFISGLECNSSDTCAVIGSANQGSTSSVFIQIESNGHWKPAIEVPSVVIGGRRLEFNILHSLVDCIDVADCTVAGTVFNEKVSMGVIEQESHGHWNDHFQLIPVNSAQSSSLIHNYDCYSKSFCVVAGSAAIQPDRSEVYAEVQENGRWRNLFTMPSDVRFSVDGAALSQPLAADCPNVKSCVVVGVLQQAQGQNSSFIARYQDHRWDSTVLNLGKSNDITQITGLSCSSTTCWAVGTVFSSDHVPLDGVVIPISV